MSILRDEFLSEEDLDLKSLTDEELEVAWMAWLEQAQSTNDEDRDCYSHGVFLREPPMHPRYADGFGESRMPGDQNREGCGNSK